MLQRPHRTIGFIEPCLPSPAKAPPTGPNWLHEIKHDGFRILARRDASGVRLITHVTATVSPNTERAIANGSGIATVATNCLPG
jgi:ATP-dependent DNA ligase